ncbi:DNA polymerase type B, organellar and viral [Popillia japonica]|uniref:DNA-directed DNA polymerase n=1 Tax=Popillia japonica TaxID=7064 RepID=A0AAW1L703_POPJA
MEFRKLLLESGNVCPFTEATILPAACNKIYRRNFLKAGTTRAYTENHELLRNTPLNPRDAFYGGRTGASKMYHTVVEDEKIKYVDVCSLYPWTNKYGKYPVGHPKVYVGRECQNEQLNQNECTHSDEQRALTGTWVIDEVRKSIEKEGVKLNQDKIAKNPGLRQVGKAVITSFWGKLGQRARPSNNNQFLG